MNFRTSGVARGTTLHKRRAVEPGAANEFSHPLRRRAVEPARVGMLVCFTHAPAVRQPDVRVRVADVEKQKHGAME